MDKRTPSFPKCSSVLSQHPPNLCYPPFSEVRKVHSFLLEVTLYIRVRPHIRNVWNLWKLLNKSRQFLVRGSAGASQGHCTLNSTRAAVGMQPGQSLPSPLQELAPLPRFRNVDKAFRGVSRMLFYLPCCWVYCWRNHPGPLPGPSLTFSHGVGSATIIQSNPCWSGVCGVSRRLPIHRSNNVARSV